MSRILFLAMHGPAFGGKDTACELLTAMRGKGTGVVVSRFAEPIYEMIRTRVPEANSRMTKEEKERPRAELGGLSIRQMAVGIGEGARSEDADVWIKLWVRKCLEDVTDHLLALGVPNVVVLVPDLRKEGERLAFDRLPEQLMCKLDEAFPDQRGKCWAAAKVVHIKPRNAPQNAQFNAATETPLVVRENDLVVHNDHSRGLKSLGRGLATGLASSTPFSARQLALDLLDLGRWQEVVDAHLAPVPI